MFCTALAHAQIPIQWGARYNAPPDMADDSRDIVVDAAGNAYVTGSGFNSSGNLDVITIKYDANGNQQWVRNYDRGVSGNDEGKSIAIDATGNVYVTGYSFGSTTSGDALVLKYDNAGTLQWSSYFNGADNNMDEARSIAVDAAGNSYICGYTSDSMYFFNTLTVCYNSAGVQQWAQMYDGPVSGNDELLDLIIDASANVYVTGNSEQASQDYDFITIKYNSAGSQQWMQTYAGPAGGDFGKAITLDGNGNVIVGGQSGFTGNWFDFLTVKYDAAGVQQWTARYNNGSNRYEDLWDVATDNAGYVYVTGQSQSVGNNQSPQDAATVKYTPAGTEVWVRRYDGGFSGDDRAYAMVLDDTANVYIAGYSKNTSNNDYLVVKYDSSGTEEFVLRFNSQYNQGEQINAIALNNGDIYVTGQSANSANEDYLTLKYSYSAVGVNEYSQTSMISVYPNPGNSLINLTLNEPTSETSSIQIMDLTGRVVLSPSVPAGSNSLQINISELAAGTYSLNYFSSNGELAGHQMIVKN